MLMNRYSHICIMTVMVALLTLFTYVEIADARGLGGGLRGGGGIGSGGFSRGGVARGGGFSSRSSARPSRQVGQPRQPSRQDFQSGRQDALKDRQAQRQDAAQDRQARRQDFIEDNHDDWDNRWHDNDGEFLAGAVVGAAIANSNNYNTTVYTTLPCSVTPVTYNGISYYNCSAIWYERVYSGGNVTYIQTAPPPGY